MRVSAPFVSIAAAAVVAAALACEPGGTCDADGAITGSGALDVCPPEPQGYATVRGTVTWADGAPLAGRTLYVSCGAAGAYDDRTDAAGRFETHPVLAVPDTLLEPLPERNPDGSLPIRCRIIALLGSSRNEILDSLDVPFFPSRQAVVATVVTLRSDSLPR